MTTMSTDVVIVSFNTRELLKKCLESLIRVADELQDGKIIVVDNASADGSSEMVEHQFPHVHLLRQSTNIGFGPANNRGFAAGTAPYVLFLNSDTVVHPLAILRLREFLAQNMRFAAVGPRLVFPDGSFHPSCRRFPTVLRNLWQLSGMEARLGHPHYLCNWLSQKEHRSGIAVDMVSGACFMIKRAIMEKIGGFDEKIFLYEEEMDIFLRIRRLGHRVGYINHAVVEHHHGASSGEKLKNDFPLYHQFKSKYYCFRKHYGAARAKLVYLSDQAILTCSATLNRFRGTPSDAQRLAELSRKAYLDARLI